MRKWHSGRGASILLALLFLLLCMMVGASVIMAAASNSGKIRSNQEEQQRYLALSSALRLVCDELERMEYVGRYRHGHVDVYSWVPPVYDAEGKIDEEGKWVDSGRDRHFYWQQQGLLRRRDSAEGTETQWHLMNTIPFQHDLDKVFAGSFGDLIDDIQAGDEYSEADRRPLAPVPGPYALTLTPSVGDDRGTLSNKVRITAEMNAVNGQIVLTGTFEDDDTYVMTAVLNCAGTPGNDLRLNGRTGNSAHLRDQMGNPIAISDLSADNARLNETGKRLTWSLWYMAKGKKEVPGP